MRRLLLSIALLLGLAMEAGAQSAFQPVAVVNDRVITRYDVEQRARLLVLNGARRSPELGSIALDQLIEDRVRLAEAERVGVEVDEAEIAEAVADYAAQRNLETAELERRLAGAGVSKGALERALTADLAWRKLVRGRFSSRAEPSEAEIAQEIALAATGRARAFRLAEIGLPFGGRGEEATLELAERLSAELDQGGDFAAAARRYSRSPSAAEGGAVGWVPESALPAEAAEALSELEPGGVTPPIPATGGVVILKLLDQRTEAAPWADAGEVELVAIRAVDDDAEAARARLAELVAQAPGCDEAQAVAGAADLQADRSPPTDIGALPPQIAEAVAPLSEGEISAPVRFADGYVAFVVCERSEGADPEARDRLRGQLRTQRLNRFADGYLQELRGEAVVEMR